MPLKWVLGRGYALQTDLVNNTTLLTEHTLTLDDHETRLSTTEGTLSTIDASYVDQNTLNTLVTQSDLAAYAYVTSSEFTPVSNQVIQNTTDVSDLQGRWWVLKMLSQNDLIGVATEDWVNSNAALGSIVSNLANYVSVDPLTDTVLFSGANVQIVSGSGMTDDDFNTTGTLLGRGNLTIGYNEQDSGDVQTGSHNLIVGRGHSNSGIAGVLLGENGDITSDFASILGGKNGSISGDYATISGGFENIATGNYSSVQGGYQNGQQLFIQPSLKILRWSISILGGSDNSIWCIVMVERKISSGLNSSIVGGTGRILCQFEHRRGWI